MERATLLSVKDLRTRFHIPEGTVYAVNGISYELHQGETLAVVGESGCGKSVSMMSILGLIPTPPGEIASGSAIYRDRDLLKLSESDLEDVRGREIAMIFQDPMTALNPVLTIGRQLSETLRKHMGMDQRKADERSAQLLEGVGIPDAAQRLSDYPHQFSGGMRQRAMIAMALSCVPSVLIADEPTTALDVTIQAQILRLFGELQEKRKMAILQITHDLSVVASVANRIYVMYAGIVVEMGSVGQIFHEPCHPYTMGLLESLPGRRERGQELATIPGAVPDPTRKPPGCPFHPRCPYVQDSCHSQFPEMCTFASSHLARCPIIYAKRKAYSA